MNKFKLSKNIDGSKIFIVNLSELEGKLEPYYYQSYFKELIKKIEDNPQFDYLPLRKVISNITDGSHHSPESDAIFKFNYVTVKDIDDDGNLDLTNCLKISEYDYNLLVKNGCQPKINDVLFSKDGTIGKIHHVKKNDFVVLSSLAILRPKKNIILPEYLELVLKLDLVKKFILRSMGGSAIKRIVLINLRELKIPLPKISLQEKIIENYKVIHKLRQKKLTKAKTLLEKINNYLLEELRVTLPNQDISLENRINIIKFSETEDRIDPFYYLKEFKEIEKSILESEWNVVTLNEIFQINRGGSPRPINNYYTKEATGVNWIKIGDTKGDDKYIYSTKQKIKPEGARYSRKVLVGDFVLSNSMSFGRPYIMMIEGYIHDGWLLFRPKSENVNKDYLHCILSSQLMYRLFKKSTIGGVVDNLNISLVKKIKIPLPSLKKQTEIANHIQDLRTQAKQLQQEAKEEIENAKREVERMILGE